MNKQLIYIFICMLVAVQLAAQQKPNIIFIFADDLGYADIGCYGQQEYGLLSFIPAPRFVHRPAQVF
jgi:hypothetical protein